jgi:hypothetical protein
VDAPASTATEAANPGEPLPKIRIPLLVAVSSAPLFLLPGTRHW